MATSVSGDRVYIDLMAYNRDGTIQHFSGYCIVEGGVLTAANIRRRIAAHRPSGRVCRPGLRRLRTSVSPTPTPGTGPDEMRWLR